MNLELVRRVFTDASTIGDLFVEGEFEAYTLEDPVRDVKIPGETAIPYGRYQVIVNYSQRFKRRMPLLLNVPGFTGVRIHPGNRAVDTEGCILVGQIEAEDEVRNSRLAFRNLLDRIELGLETGPVFIKIIKEA